jgi:hypothetical protein
MWDQVNNSQLRYKDEIMEAIQAAAKFNEEILNTVNLFLNTFQETNIRNIDPRAEQFKDSQEKLIRLAMNEIMDQLEGMQKEMKP